MRDGLLTLSDARDELKQFVDNGSCNSTTANSRITEACKRLIVKADWPHTTQTVRVRTNKYEFPLPRECESIRSVNHNNEAAHAFNKSYEFVASGPGEVRCRGNVTGFKDVVDNGMFPTMYDMPTIENFDTDGDGVDDNTSFVDRVLEEGFSIAAFSTEVSDTIKEITLYGTNKMQEDAGSVASGIHSPGETIKINRWYNGEEGVVNVPMAELVQTSKKYRELQRWVKPVTAAYISLYVIDPENRYWWFLAKAHPDDLRPMWRRYKVAGIDLTGDSANFLLLCKMKAMVLTRDDDILPIQNMNAIKLMLIAIGKENAGDLQTAVAYEANATRLLKEEKEDHEVSSGVPVIIDFESELAMVSSGGVTL